MKHIVMRKTVAFLLAALLLVPVLLLSACGAEEVPPAESETQTRYVEADVTPEGAGELRPSSFYQLPGGQYLLTGLVGQSWHSWKSEDGQAWKEQGMDWLPGVLADHEDSQLAALTEGPDGSWWLGLLNREDELEKAQLLRVDESGNAAEVEVPAFSEVATAGEIVVIESLYTTGEGLAVVCRQGASLEETVPHIYYITASDPAETLTTIVSDNFFTISGVQQNSVYALDIDHTLHSWDLESGEKNAFSPGLPEELSGLAVGADGGCTYVDENGLHHVVENGSLVQDLATDARMTFTDPGVAQSYPCPNGTDGYLVAYTFGHGGFKLCAYSVTVGSAADMEPDAHLTIWAMEPTNILQQAIFNFRNANPTIEVTVEYGYPEGTESTVTLEDVIRGLNTRLLAGDCPDVLILDGLPTESFIGKGMLTDISGLLEDPTLFYENILGAHTVDGKTYAYPAAFSAPFLFYAKEMPTAETDSLTSLSAIVALMQTGPGPEKIDGWDPFPYEQQPYLYYDSAEDMFNSLYPAVSAEIFPGGTTLDEKALHSFLSATKDIADYCGFGGGSANRVELVIEDEYSGPQSASLTLFDQGQTRLGITDISGGTLFMGNGRERATQPLAGNSFVPRISAGVPAAAANPEDAKAFIRLLLTDDAVQSAYPDFMEGIPVKKGALPAMVREIVSMYEENDVPRDMWGFDADTSWDGVFDSLDTPSVTDAELKQKVQDVATELYAGGYTVEEAVDAVVAQTELFLAERS